MLTMKSRKALTTPITTVRWSLLAIGNPWVLPITPILPDGTPELEESTALNSTLPMAAFSMLEHLQADYGKQPPGVPPGPR